jgi:hypothetical protein
MIEVTVESIRVSLINQQRLVVLRENESARYLPIWIGPFEAEAITMGLQGHEVQRPMTHDLLRQTVEQLGGQLRYICVSDLQEETFYALVVVDQHGQTVEIDARPSDAIALAVRSDVPIYVSEDVMERAGQVPASEYEEGPPAEATSEDRLGLFREFIEGLDLDTAGGEE